MVTPGPQKNESGQKKSFIFLSYNQKKKKSKKKNISEI